MDFPPDVWDVFPAGNFELAEPQDPEQCGVEVWNNGRIMDHFLFTLGGSKLLEATLKLKQVIGNDNLPDWELNYRLWPRDVMLRRNMLTSDWVDRRSLVSSWDVTIVDVATGNEVEAQQYLATLDSLGTNKIKISSSLRWGFFDGPDKRVRLHLLALPGLLVSFSSKPAFKG